MPRDNSFSDSDQETPMPRGFEGGSKDFGVQRAIDGHDHYPTMVSRTAGDPDDPNEELDELVADYSNVHYPAYEDDDLMGY